ncbi:MAG: LytTR family DNA-binding domain-containing protein [Bacteroidota bacterium]
MIVQKMKKSRLCIASSKAHIRIGSKHKGTYIEKLSIVYIEACESYSWIHLTNGSKVLSSKTIGYYQALLTDDKFSRVHRSYLINLSHLKRYEPDYRLVHLKGEFTLPVSHRKNREIAKMVSKQHHTPFRMAV